MSCSHKAFQNLELLNQATILPSWPGVYRYFDKNNTLLYVGKAINLKRRVSSYFQKQHHNLRLQQMVTKIARIETTVVSSEAEALLLENNLIKTLRPKYNILFRDDKSYPYLKITGKSSAQKRSSSASSIFPRVAYYRGTIEKNHRYFGPFPSALAVKDTIDILQKIFRLRTCEDTVFVNRSRACLLHQIQRCSGPCMRHITEQDYNQDVLDAERFLLGQAHGVITELQARMMQHAERLEFEQAALIRNKIQSLSKVLHQQSVENLTDHDVDILAVCVQGGHACVNLAMVRGGRHLGDRAYFPKQLEWALDLPEDGKERLDAIDREKSFVSSLVLQAFVAQHYLSTIAPALIISSEPLPELLVKTIAQHAIQAQTRAKKDQVHVVCKPKGQRRRWLDMAKQNADLQLQRFLLKDDLQRARTSALAEILGLSLQNEQELDALRIECFDISHSAGEDTKAACVVFEKHAMQTNQYRRFNIKNITPGDDYAAMRQALRRRYDKFLPLQGQGARRRISSNKFISGAQSLPDLVLVDGGRGQVEAAREVFIDLKIDISCIVGVEKSKAREVGLEELVFADGRKKLTLKRDSLALMLVAQIRDEAHRFAITGMRAARARKRTGSSGIEAIEGIGPKRRASLFQNFGGISGLIAASQEDIIKVPGFSRRLAEEIYRALH